jgi:hypothetical protein
MKTYYYSLTETGRINHIVEEVIDYYQTIELTEKEFESIVLFQTGIKDNKLVDMGQEPEVLLLYAKRDKKERLQSLKYFLIETDWKVIVNSELIQAGLPPKYPDLHEERQAWRDGINDLEAEIDALE